MLEYGELRFENSLPQVKWREFDGYIANARPRARFYPARGGTGYAEATFAITRTCSIYGAFLISGKEKTAGFMGSYSQGESCSKGICTPFIELFPEPVSLVIGQDLSINMRISL